MAEGSSMIDKSFEEVGNVMDGIISLLRREKPMP